MNTTNRRKKFNEKVVYFADWNPDKLSGDVLPITKVGISNDPEQRMNDLTIPPFKSNVIAILHTKCNAAIVENLLHEKFKARGFHINGEWFSLPDGIIGWAERNDEVSIGGVENVDW